MRQIMDMNLDDTKQLILIGKALSVETRVEIIKLLQQEELNINEIAEKLSIPPSSTAAHIKVLEEAGIIKTTLLPGIRGSMKRCHVVLDQVMIQMQTRYIFEENVDIIEMPIGNYVDYKVEPTCGLVSEKGPIDEEDEPRCFYNPNRSNAKLLWLGKGYVEYRFPNSILREHKAKKLEISAELCSEDHDYNMDWPSDITLWVNGIEAGTWTCPSDFGGRRGKLNPDWWPDKNTQYGQLKCWKITEIGTYLGDEFINQRAIHDYQLEKEEYITIRFGIKEDSTHIGGMNLFGNGFGDYAQDIIMRLSYE